MIIELNSAFRHIVYTDATHCYYDKNTGEELTSITKLISKLKEPFNSRFWSTMKAYEFSGCQTKQIWLKGGGYNDKMFKADGVQISVFDNHDHLPVTPEMVSAQWNVDSIVGKTRGSWSHAYLENLENRLIDKPKIELPSGLTTVQAVSYIRTIDIAEKLCLQFVDEFDYLIPVAIEYKVGDSKAGIAGTPDRLYWNTQVQELQIWDFKTDKKIASSNKYQKLKLFDLDDCEISKYSVQTSAYKWIIESNTNLKLGTSYIVHLNLKDERLDVHPCIDLTQQIANIDWRNI